MIVVTGNAYKFGQIKECFPHAEQRSIDLVEIQSLDAAEIITHKLSEARQNVSGEILVEDTSLICEGLNGLPGPLVKFFLQTVGCEGIWQMAYTSESTQAQAVTTLGYLSDAGDIIITQGITIGQIVSPRGSGHGWNPIFQPEGSDQTYAEMTEEEHRQWNMRLRALQELQKRLSDLK